MNSFIYTLGKFLRDFLISILLWTYVSLVAFTWYFARMTPELAVLLRVAASVINDLVWIPFGILVWDVAIVSLLKGLQVPPKKSFATGIAVFAAVALFHVLSPETAFRFLFVPLIVAIIFTVRKLVSGRDELHVFGRLLPLLLIALFIVHHYQYQMLPNQKGDSSGVVVKILSYNIFCDAEFEDRLKVIDTIRRENADIVCCIEYNFRKDGPLFRKALGGLYPYSVLSDNPRNIDSGSIIFSKYPIQKQKVQELKRARNRWSSRISMIFAEVEVHGRKLNLVNYHLKSVGHYIEYIADKDYALRWKIDWAGKNELKYDREKLIQAQSLIELSGASQQPTILCGDLNDTPNSKVFHLIQRHYTNAFSARGWGLGATFGESRIKEKLGWVPLASRLARDVLRIDHIFVSKDVRIARAAVLSDAPGSDHKPVVAIVEID
jgi:endonuclease/exonuclease/phosphatase family metal-dependent hydrolase